MVEKLYEPLAKEFQQYNPPKPEDFAPKAKVAQQPKGKIEWPELRQDLRNGLNSFVNQMLEKFDIISKNRLTLTGQEMKDTSMYNGTSGVAFALWKYTLLLQNEKDMAKFYPNVEKGLKAQDEAISKM